MDDKIRSNGRYNYRKNRNLYLMMLPFLTFFFIFTVLPVLFSMFISFTDYDVLQTPSFVGFDNYRRLFLEDPLFTKSIQNTFVFAVICGPVGYVLAFFVAWLINELPAKLRALFTVIFYAPSMSAHAFVLFLFLFSGDPFGWLNATLMRYGVIHDAVLWLSDSDYMMPIVIGVQLWMSLGVGFLSFVAGLQTVDKAQLEAGYIDGIRNRWQELWFIILPNMRPMLMFGAIISITSAFSVGSITEILTGFPSARYATHTMVNHLVDYGNIRMEMGYASAIAVILLTFMLVSNGLIQKFLRRIGS
jgi:multiple sugar transport system permease protein